MNSQVNYTVRKVNRQPEGEHRITLISKSLSKLLRHQANKEGLNIDSQGFVSLREILNHKFLKSLKATPSDVYSAVYTNSKQRFKIVKKENGETIPLDSVEMINRDEGIDKLFICAVQGHSIKEIDSYGLVKLAPNELPDIIIHGTYLKTLPLILKSGGLSKMKRLHIHFAQGLTDAFIKHRKTVLNRNNGVPGATPNAGAEDPSSGVKVISGMRQSCDALIYLDTEKLRETPDLVFYKSANGVILSPGNSKGFINVEYFKKIVNTYGEEIPF